ncbi:unnamed protein product, partial [Timema podura]|nr:unnamed protein product [Timema podura]
MSICENDKLFLRIIKEEKHVALFLDAVFGFLYRCTDFYKTHNDLNEDSERAKEILLQTFQKWKKQAQEDHEYSRIKRLASDGVAPHAVTEVDVTSESPIVCPNSLADTGTSEPRNTLSTEAASNQEVNNAQSGYDSKTQQASDCYNGAVRDGYRWSQSITDLDVQVKILSPPTPGFASVTAAILVLKD